jgi:hypothetical protein
MMEGVNGFSLISKVENVDLKAFVWRVAVTWSECPPPLSWLTIFYSTSPPLHLHDVDTTEKKEV